MKVFAKYVCPRSLYDYCWHRVLQNGQHWLWAGQSKNHNFFEFLFSFCLGQDLKTLFKTKNLLNQLNATFLTIFLWNAVLDCCLWFGYKLHIHIHIYIYIYIYILHTVCTVYNIHCYESCVKRCGALSYLFLDLFGSFSSKLQGNFPNFATVLTSLAAHRSLP